MDKTSVIKIVLGVCVIGWGSGMNTQEAGAQPFQILEEISIAPGTTEEFEAASKNRTARMVAGDVAFGRLVSVGSDNVYRFLTFLDEDLASVAEWREQIAAMPASPNPGGLAAGSIDHIDRSVWQVRRDLSHVPDAPRLQNTEIGFVYDIRLYPKFGAVQEVAEILRRISALSTSHNINSVRRVSELVVGPETPAFSLVLFARDREDFNATRTREREIMGAEFQALVNQLLRLCRKSGQEGYRARPDLGYQPSN